MPLSPKENPADKKRKPETAHSHHGVWYDFLRTKFLQSWFERPLPGHYICGYRLMR